MKRILFTGDTLSENRREALREKGFDVVPARIDMNENELIEAINGFDGYILGGEEIATGTVLRASKKNLKVITFFGTGYEKYIDVHVANELGIAVTNTPNANANSVAEFTVSLILASIKQIVPMGVETKQGNWNKISSFDICGKTIGIVGMGNIGRKVAKILKAGFDAKIVYYSRNRKPEIENEFSATYLSLNELCKVADIVTIHAAYDKETLGMIGMEQFQQMKKSTILINCARAELVNAESLQVALKNDIIAMAAFDCYYIEPVPSPAEDKFGLMSLPDARFLLTPHTAYNSADAILNMENIAIENTISLLCGNECENIVN